MENNKNTAVLVLSYCLYKDGTRLSIMAQESAKIGIDVVCNGKASHVIFSTAYGCYKKEETLKRYMAYRRGVTHDKVKILRGVTRTSDEIVALNDVLKTLGTSKLIVVCEKYHVRRAKRFLEYSFPELEIEIISFQTKYERTLEPFPKGHRGSIVTWWLWCFFCNLFNK